MNKKIYFFKKLRRKIVLVIIHHKISWTARESAGLGEAAAPTSSEAQLPHPASCMSSQESWSSSSPGAQGWGVMQASYPQKH